MSASGVLQYSMRAASTCPHETHQYVPAIESAHMYMYIFTCALAAAASSEPLFPSSPAIGLLLKLPVRVRMAVTDDR